MSVSVNVSNSGTLFHDPPQAPPDAKRIMFVVVGQPATAGSKRAFPIRRRDGSLGVAVAPDNERVRSWMGTVADMARKVYSGPLLTGAIRLKVVFIRPRPASHFGSGRNSETLKPSAPIWPTTKPDLTKLRRAIEDGLTGVVWRDDSQIVEGIDYKCFGAAYLTVVDITALDSSTEERF